VSPLLAHHPSGGAPAATVVPDAGVEIAGRGPADRTPSTPPAGVAAGALWARLRSPLPLRGMRCEAPCALIGAILLLGIFLLDGRVGSQGTVESIAALPILAATRLMRRRLLLPLVTLGITLDLVNPIVHEETWLTAATQAGVLLLLCAVGRGATVSWMRLTATERRARALADEHRRAVELDESKSDFLRLASHEVRAPLTVLLGYVGLLEDGMFGEMPPAARSQVLPVLRSKVDELVALSEAMLQAARLDDGRLELETERVDVCDLAREAASRVEPMLGPAHRLGVDCPPGAVMVDGDRLRLVTVLVNLLANAVKYSPSGGEVRCVVRTGEGLAVITVSDQGIGIDPEDLPRLFQRFTRVASGVDAEIPGTGLGLYIARQLARKHGGDIIAASKRGVGSSFTVSLPLAG
jgi:signal transduction histidine kinase